MQTRHLHRGRWRKSGSPYFLHKIAFMHFLQDDFGLAILRKVYHIYPASLKSIIPELRHRLASLRKTTQTTQYEMKRAVDSSRPNVRQPSRPKHQIFHLLNLL